MKLSLSNAIPFAILMLIAIIALFVPSFTEFSRIEKYNSADIAWLIVEKALIFLMPPGLAFFYIGMTHRKNVISTMIKSTVATGILSIL